MKKISAIRAAEIIGISRQQVYNQVRAGKLELTVESAEHYRDNRPKIGGKKGEYFDNYTGAPTMARIITAEEAAEILGTSTTIPYRLRTRGDIRDPISGGIDYDKVIAYRDSRPKRGRPRNKK